MLWKLLRGELTDPIATSIGYNLSGFYVAL
jgi:hypothetical protein